MKDRILIAEDDRDIVELLTLYLERDGFSVSSAPDGAEALEMLQQESYSMALVDIMMPKLNGYELIRRIRQESNIPIIILSARNLDTDKVMGLDLGADAYITKPFNPLEVVAYAKAMSRRYFQLGAQLPKEPSGSLLCVQNLTLDTQSFVLKKDGQPISMTSTELRILAKLMKHPGKIFTKSQLYECINGKYMNSDNNAIMVHISNIRAKLEDDPSHPRYIITVRGLGYKIEEHSQKEA